MNYDDINSNFPDYDASNNAEGDFDEIQPESNLFNQQVEPNYLQDEYTLEQAKSEIDPIGDEVSYEQVELDTDGNGTVDTVIFGADSDFNGVIDTQGIAQDLNTDGELDFFQTDIDTNGDQIIDTSVIGSDLDSDGIVDVISIGQDTNFDGILDDVSYVESPLNGGESQALSLDFDIYDNFDPNDPTIDYSEIAGDPVEDMQHWEFQGETNRCALYAQKFAYEALSGQEIDIEEFTGIATENGWFTEVGGTTLEDMDNMLDYFGIENDVNYGADLNDIITSLEKGEKVIVALDSNEIWFSDDSEIFGSDASGHAVQVIGVDTSDPENPIIILNDSGCPDGCGAMVDANDFMEAWNTFDNYLVTAK